MDGASYAYAADLERLRIANCNYIITGLKAHLDTVKSIHIHLLVAPEIFDTGHPANVVVAHRKAFAQLCAGLVGAGYARPADLSLFDFHTAVAYLNSQRETE